MRLHIQNNVWTQSPYSTRTFHQFLPGSVRTANAQKESKQREVLEKAAKLVQGNNAEKIELQNSGPAELSTLLVSEKDIPKKAAQKIENYYQTAGSLTDGITRMEARLKFLQSEYGKYTGEDSGKHAEKMKGLIESEYQNMSGLLKPAADMLSGELHLSEKVYGKEFTEEYQALLGDVPDKLRDIAESLKGAGSVDEALKQLAAAKEKLGTISEDLAGRYQEYTGREVTRYSYKSETDFSGQESSYALLWNWSEITVDDSNAENLSDYGIDIHALNQIPKAVNLLDTKA